MLQDGEAPFLDADDGQEPDPAQLRTRALEAEKASLAVGGVTNSSGAGASAVESALEARDRRAAAPPAPAHGLYLMRVRYPRVGWIPKEPLNVVA